MYMMAELRNMVGIIVLVILGAGLLESTEAEEYTVGGSTGWTSFPAGGASFYSQWASNFAFKVNDILVFNFESGSHAVAELGKENYENCNVDENIEAFDRGPARIRLNRTGDFYFTCTFSGHCSSGQKLTIKVTTNSSSSPSSPPPQQTPSPSSSLPTSPSNEGSPSSSPTGPGAIAPPPQGSAASLAATFSLFLITIAINFFSLF